MTQEMQKTEEKIHTSIQQEYKIFAEYEMIASEKLGGVYVIPSFGNSLLWYGVLFVRHGFYEEAVFRFNVSLPDNFPDDKTVPTVIFQNETFHPLICPYTGTLDLSYAFPQWRCGEDHIWQLLKYIQAIFNDPMECLRSSPSTSSSSVVPSGKWPNIEAAELLTQNRAAYIAKAKESVATNMKHIYDDPPTDDPHYITFEPYKEEIHDPIKQRIKEGKEPIASTSANAAAASKGLSWVKEGEYAPLSME